MDSLVPAFIAALLAGIGDRPAWLAAILADRYRAPWAVLLGATIALTAANIVAAAGAMLVAPILTPNARGLMLALALLLAGFDSVWRLKPPERLERWRLGAFGTALVGGFILAFGDRSAFLVFGFAARGPSPALAVAGASAAGLVLAFIAILCGEATWHRPVRRLLSTIGGVLLMLCGTIAALSALRLL